VAQRTGRILALDWGKRRIGVAVSDELRLTARGLPTIEHQNKQGTMEALARIVEQYQARLVIVGNPVHMSGAEGRGSQQATQFARTLARQTGVEIRLWDERLTTREAQRVLRETGAGRGNRAAVDRLAAVLILQSYLDYLAAGAEQENSPAT
jgi:putative Holliday junction resolvase